jgi:DNA primase
MITPSSIDNVLETARVEEVIGDFVHLKRAGSNLKGLSPFSAEKSPSFMVSPVKQIWKDFSSGKGGNVVSFLMEHEHFTYPEAIKYLAKKYNIEIEETVYSNEDKALNSEKESMYLVSEYAQKYFQDVLLNQEEGKAIGLSYFKERGFKTETITKFGLGYSPNIFDAFTKKALKDGYQLDYLEKTGLTIKGETQNFDRFKNRVMFPIHSMSGRVLGFGGRILTNDKKVAKYLNSPESEIYHKSKILYGIFQAKQSIAKQNNCYLVEGYTDVIQMFQAGIENVVASSGTALTPDQIRLINRLTKNITVLFDGDAAGLRASLRGIDLILEEGMNVRVCTFPEGEDPDSFAKRNTLNEIIKYFEINSKDFIQFKASLLVNDSVNDPIKKAEHIRDMVQSISKISDRLKREIYIQETSKIMDVSEDVLYSTLAQFLKKDVLEREKQFQKSEAKFEVIKEVPVIIQSLDLLENVEFKLLEILILYGETAVDFEDYLLKFDDQGKEIEEKSVVYQKIFRRIYFNLQQDEVAFSNPVFQSLYQKVIQYFLEHEKLDLSIIIPKLDNNESKVISDILMNYEKYELHGWMEKKQVFVKDRKLPEKLSSDTNETIFCYREFLILKLIKNLIKEITNSNIDYIEIKNEINDYNKLRVFISRKIGRVRSLKIENLL